MKKSRLLTRFGIGQSRAKQGAKTLQKATKITELRNVIAATLNDIEFQAAWDCKTFGLFFLDLLYLEEVHALLNNAIESERNPSEKALESLLKARWKAVLNTPFCYTLNPYTMINNHYKNLAAIVFGDEANEKLMPTLPKDEPIDLTELNDMVPGEFILVSRGTGEDAFIHIPTFLDEVIFKFERSQDDCLHLKDSGLDKYRSIYREEIDKMLLLHPFLKDFFKIILRQEKTKMYSIREELRKLRNGLRKGDVKHDGTETDAGMAAFEAIREFHKFYSKLPRWQKDQLRELSGLGESAESFGDIYDNIMRDPEQIKATAQNDDDWEPELTSCVHLRGDFIEDIFKNPMNFEILDASLEVQEALARLIELRDLLGVKLEEQRKSIDRNQKRVEDNADLYQGKFVRANWTLYTDKLNKMLVIDTDQDQYPIDILKKLMVVLQGYFPKRISKRSLWFNAFIALNQVAHILPNTVEEYRMHYVRECWVLLRMLAHDFRMFDNGVEFRKEIDKIYANSLSASVDDLTFILPKDYQEQLKSQHCRPKKITSLMKKRTCITVENAKLDDDCALYISINGKSGSEREQTLVCKKMSYLKASDKWVYWMRKSTMTENPNGVKFWIGDKNIEVKDATDCVNGKCSGGVKATCADMSGYYSVVNPKACSHDLTMTKLHEVTQQRRGVKV